MSAKNVQVARFRVRSANTRAFPQGGSTHIGRLVSVLPDDQVAVAVPGVSGTLPARLAVSLTHARLRSAIDSRQGAVILVDATGQAMVIGLLETLPSETVVPQIVEADVDGKRVRIVGNDEIVLECGNASITLRRNGRVIIKGTYVETDSAGTNRIKGAAVRIN
jgi:hypothetical protein